MVTRKKGNVRRKKKSASRKRNASRKRLIKMLFGGDKPIRLDGFKMFTTPDEAIASGTTKNIYLPGEDNAEMNNLVLIEVELDPDSDLNEYNNIHLEYLMLEQFYKQNEHSAIQVSNWTEYPATNPTMIRYLAEKCPLNLEGANEATLLKNHMVELNTTALKAFFDKLMGVAIFELPSGVNYINNKIFTQTIFPTNPTVLELAESTLKANNTVLNIDCKPPNFCYYTNNGEFEIKKLDIGVDFLICVDIDIDSEATIIDKHRSSVNRERTEFVTTDIAKCYVFLFNCMYIHMYGMGEDGKEAFKNAMKAVSEHYVNIDSLKKMKDNKLLQYMFTHYFPQKELRDRYFSQKELRDRYTPNTVNEYMTWFISDGLKQALKANRPTRRPRM